MDENIQAKMLCHMFAMSIFNMRGDYEMYCVEATNAFTYFLTVIEEIKSEPEILETTNTLAQGLLLLNNETTSQECIDVLNTWKNSVKKRREITEEYTPNKRQKI